MIIGFTGHRPDKLYGYDLFDKKYGILYNTLLDLLKTNFNKIDKVIVGGALGFDQLACEVVHDNFPTIEIILAIPCPNFGSNWSQEHKVILNDQRKYCNEIMISTNNDQYIHNLHLRNDYIINNSDIIISCWNGEGKGGTVSAIRKALNRGLSVYNIQPVTYNISKISHA